MTGSLHWSSTLLFDWWFLSKCCSCGGGGMRRGWEGRGNDEQHRGHEQTRLYYTPASYCLWCTVQNNPKSSRQVTRLPAPPTPPPSPPSTQTISKHLFWETAMLCASQWKIQRLTVHWLVEDFNYTLHNVHCARQKLTIFDSDFFLFFPLNLKSSGSERRAEGSHCESLLEIPAVSAPPRSCLYQLRCMWSIHNEGEGR